MVSKSRQGGVAQGAQPLSGLGADPGEILGRPPRTLLGDRRTRAVLEERTRIGGVALVSDRDVGKAPGKHRPEPLHPAPHFRLQGTHLGGEVVVDEERSVVAPARVDETCVDTSQLDAGEGYPRPFQHPGLYGTVRRIMFLDRGGGFDLPQAITGSVRKKDVGAHQDTVVAEGALEHRPALGQRPLGVFQGLAEIFDVLDESAVGMEASCDRAHVFSRREPARAVVARLRKLGMVDFEVQPLGALQPRHDLRLGQPGAAHFVSPEWHLGMDTL
jgi:hypothetical protein